MCMKSKKSQPMSEFSLCLGSSMLGHYTHTGFLGEMECANAIPQRIAGSSAGALAAALWAGGLRGDECIKEICSFSFKRSFSDFLAPFRVPGVATWGLASGIFSAKQLRNKLIRLIGEPMIEDFNEPKIEVAVTNLTKNRSEIKTAGSLIDYTLASLSLPIIYQPRKIDGDWYIDGGVANEFPYEHWLSNDAVKKIIVHTVSYDLDPPSKMSAASVFAGCHTVANKELELLRLKEVERSGKEVVFLDTRIDPPKVFHGKEQAHAMIEAGAATARKWLADQASA